MPETLVLRRPRRDDEDEVMRAHRATSPAVPCFLHSYRDGMSFGRYLEALGEQERGVNLPPHHVPSTFLFAFKGPRIVGRVSIRHELNDVLLRVGGHIGYVVVPEFRRQGHATTILRLALHIAHEKLGIRRVLVTCDDDNIGSIRTIENNGGVLEDVISGPDLDTPKRRYWIDAIMALLDVTTRQAHPGDAAAIASAHLDSIRSLGPGFYPPEIVAAWTEGLSPEIYVKAMKGGEAFFIATGTLDGQPVVLGFATHRVDDAQDGASVYVRGRAARQGVGSALLRLAEEHARTSGATSIQIQASLAGVAFYEANGFEETGRGVAELLSGRSMPCVFMRKVLT